jgi:hypothetical protein
MALLTSAVCIGYSFLPRTHGGTQCGRYLARRQGGASRKVPGSPTTLIEPFLPDAEHLRVEDRSSQMQRRRLKLIVSGKGTRDGLGTDLVNSDNRAPI